jgi:hypothetical protein
MTDMNNQNLSNSKKGHTQKIIVAVVIILLVISIGYFVKDKDSKPDIIEQPVTKEMPDDKGSYEDSDKEAVKPAINYDELENNKDLQKTMQERKKKYDIKNSLDMIVDSNETFKINNNEISMEKILRLAALRRGDVVEENIGESLQKKDINQYGIYVVKPGDNIWNIHFNILREYYGLKNITMDMNADEPNKKGFSSGVGKILKFSETMVVIYNLEEETIEENIDIIEPLTKIIVYNMTEIFSLLNDINYENVSKLQFDGKTIWIATDK